MVRAIILGLAGGALLGGLIGYFGRCETGGCPLTRSPMSGAIYGAVIGLVMACALGGCLREVDTYHSQYVVRVGSDAEFSDRVLDEASKPVLVDFYADWCGPCKEQAPVVEHLADEVKDWAVVAKVNVDAVRGPASTYGVRAIPTLIVFSKGKVVERMTGVQSADTLRRVLERERQSQTKEQVP